MTDRRLFDPKTPPERTSMAWERTAFSGMAVGLLMARVGASVHLALGLVGVVQVCASAVLLVWTGKHYEDLHSRLQAGGPPTHSMAVAVVGIGATAATALATLLMVVALALGE
jgi:uncharacterized membrane protein YidH (DUF202 family)